LVDWLNGLNGRSLNNWTLGRPVDGLLNNLSDWGNVVGLVAAETASSRAELLDRCIATEGLPCRTTRELVAARSLLNWSLVNWDLVDWLVDGLHLLDWSRVEI
jgi:hypothetical protein